MSCVQLVCASQTYKRSHSDVSDRTKKEKKNENIDFKLSLKNLIKKILFVKESFTTT